MAVRAAREKTEPQRPVGIPGEDLGQQGRCLVVPHHEVIPDLGVDRAPGVTEMSVDHPGLVLLVVVHPELDSGLLHDAKVTPHRSGSYPGLGCGSEKHDLSWPKTAGVGSSMTTE